MTDLKKHRGGVENYAIANLKSKKEKTIKLKKKKKVPLVSLST